jgi:hypothetical protein
MRIRHIHPHLMSIFLARFLSVGRQARQPDTVCQNDLCVSRSWSDLSFVRCLQVLIDPHIGVGVIVDSVWNRKIDLALSSPLAHLWSDMTSATSAGTGTAGSSWTTKYNYPGLYNTTVRRLVWPNCSSLNHTGRISTTAL